MSDRPGGGEQLGSSSTSSRAKKIKADPVAECFDGVVHSGTRLNLKGVIHSQRLCRYLRPRVLSRERDLRNPRLRGWERGVPVLQKRSEHLDRQRGAVKIRW